MTSILLPNQKIAIWGYGREGQSAYDFVRKHNETSQITIVDAKPIANAPFDVDVLIGKDGLNAVASGGFDLVIKSPGVSLYLPEIFEAEAKGTKFTSATNLWLELWQDAFTIGITGTKGKSTTSSLLHFLFGLVGKRSKLLGNVGTAMLGQAPGEDVTVLELSSYQIADLNHFPKLALITNLFKEHGPWHQGHDNYFRDKMRLVTVDQSIPAAINAQKGLIDSFVNNRPNITYFQSPQAFHVEGNSVFDGASKLDVRNLALEGQHNLVNLAGAFTVLKMAGAYIENRIWDFSNFSPLPHRLQKLQLPNGVLAVNDSISTIPETTLEALVVYGGRPIHLILGGVDRGQDFSALLSRLKSLDTLRGIYLPDGRHADYPSTGEALEREIVAARLPLGGRFEIFDGAVNAALGAAMSGDIILLSPGAASQNEFADFEKRGARFLELCEAHKP